LFVLGALFSPYGAVAEEPVLALFPPESTYEVGDRFTVEVLLNTQGQDVNAVASYIEYPDNLLVPVSINMANSPMHIVVERNYGMGKIEISGGTPTPGFNGLYQIATIEFEAQAPGYASLSFLPDSAVLTDKGNQNILGVHQDAVMEIINIPNAPQIQPEPVFSTFHYEEPTKTFLRYSLLASLFSFLF